MLKHYDTTTIRLRRIARTCFQFNASKKRTCQFFVVVVVDWNRNCDIDFTAQTYKNRTVHGE